jgi:hypothetical protein
VGIGYERLAVAVLGQNRGAIFKEVPVSDRGIRYPAANVWLTLLRVRIIATYITIKKNGERAQPWVDGCLALNPA